jgi:hypothetical protein
MGGSSSGGAGGTGTTGGAAGGSSPGGTVGSSGGSGAVGAAGGATAGAGGAAGGALNPASIIVQDNFDKTAAAAWPDETKWAPYEQWARDQGIAPVIDAAKSHSPPHSVRVQSSNVGLGSFLVPVMGFPVENNSFYVRVWINWEKATSTIMGHSGFLVGSTARDNSGTEVRLGISNKGPGDQAMLDLNLIGGGGGEVTRYSNGFTDGGDPGQFSGNGFQFAADTWVCLEAFFNGGGHEFRVWMDSVEVEAMHVTDFRGGPNGQPRTTWAPSYTILKIGAQDYDANLGKIWYDDVIVAKERVGCQ